MTKASDVGNYGEWELSKILIEGKNADYGDNSLATGWWAGEPVLATRYDMRHDQQTQCGYPNAQGGRARWFIVPKWMWLSVLAVADISEQERQDAVKFVMGL